MYNIVRMIVFNKDTSDFSSSQQLQTSHFLVVFVSSAFRSSGGAKSRQPRQALLPISAGDVPLRTPRLSNLAPKLNHQKDHEPDRALRIARTSGEKKPPQCLARSPSPNRRTYAGCRRPTTRHPISAGRRRAEPSLPRTSISAPSSGSGKRPFPRTSFGNSRTRTCSSRVCRRPCRSDG